MPSKKGTGFVQPLVPHEHWHVDVSCLNIAGTFYCLCSVLDGRSRSVALWEMREKREERDMETISQRARACQPGVTPRLLRDNGPQFVAKDFEEFIRIAGLTHVKTSPYYPQSNGKIERWHKTLESECIRVLAPLSLEDARRLVADYVEHYNNVRLHSAIGSVAPQAKLTGQDKTIIAQRDRKLAEARERRKQQRQAVHDPEPAPAAAARPVLDFAALRAVVTIVAVLALLGVDDRSTGAQHRGPCPLHGSTAGTSRCFSVNGATNTFHCFKCGRTGHALALWAAATNQNSHAAAVGLCQRLGLSVPTLPPLPPSNREEASVVSGLAVCTIP